MRGIDTERRGGSLNGSGIAEAVANGESRYMARVRQIFACAFVVPFILTVPRVARAQTASEYLRYCEAFENSTIQQGNQLSIPDGAASNCWHFFTAFRELADLTDAQTRRPFLGLCIPTTLPLTQLIRIFTNYAEAHPELLQTEPAAIAWRAGWQYFDCNKQQ